MTKQIDKYDVFKMQTIYNLKSLPIFLYRKKKLKIFEAKLAELKKAGLDDKDNLYAYTDIEDKYDIEMGKILSEAANILKTSAHSVYEMSKDLETLNPKTIKSYLEKSNILPSSFSYRFEEKQKEALYYLTFYAFIEKYGKPIEEQSPEEIVVTISLVNNENYEALGMTKEDIDLLNKLGDKDFSLTTLSDSEREFVDSYHQRYMEEVIYQNTTNREVTEQKVLKKAGNLYYQN